MKKIITIAIALSLTMLGMNCSEVPDDAGTQMTNETTKILKKKINKKIKICNAKFKLGSSFHSICESILSKFTSSVKTGI